MRPPTRTAAPFLSPAAATAIASGQEAAAVATQELTNKSVILVGERAAESAGLLSATAALADRTGAKLAWIPRRGNI